MLSTDEFFPLIILTIINLRISEKKHMANKFLKAVFIISEDILKNEDNHSLINLSDILIINGKDLDLEMLFLNK